MMSKSIEYIKSLIKKFNDNGDYHIGDELSWALDDLESKEKEIALLKEELKRERSCVDKLVKDTPHYDECNSEDYDDEENCDCGRETDLVWPKNIQKQRKIEL